MEDDPATIAVVARMLEGAGYEVLRTEDPRNVPLIAATGRVPDLILSDVEMPYLGGPELCIIVKSSPELSRVPVILMSGQRTDALDHRIGEVLGCAAYLDKPLDARTLLMTIRVVLAGVALSEQAGGV